MGDTIGFEVLKKTFSFTLPVTGQKGKMRFATRNDKMKASEAASKAKESEAANRFELTYLGSIITEINDKPGPLVYEQLKNYPEKDLLVMRACDMKLNNLEEEDFKKILESFTEALKS